jgi:hypothetical protein
LFLFTFLVPGSGNAMAATEGRGVTPFLSADFFLQDAWYI